MKKTMLMVFMMPLILTCCDNRNKPGTDNSITPRIRKKLTEIAVKYTSDKFNVVKKNVTENGILNIGDERINYQIDPSKMFVGLIDDDSKEDAIITLRSFNNHYLATIEHLILIKTGGKFILNRVVESDMKILQLKDRIITAELPTRPRSSPLYNCSSCQEIVKYKFKKGDLVRQE